MVEDVFLASPSPASPGILSKMLSYYLNDLLVLVYTFLASAIELPTFWMFAGISASGGSSYLCPENESQILSIFSLMCGPF